MGICLKSYEIILREMRGFDPSRLDGVRITARRMRILEIIRPNYTLCEVVARAEHSKIELFIVIQLFCLWCMVGPGPS